MQSCDEIFFSCDTIGGRSRSTSPDVIFKISISPTHLFTKIRINDFVRFYATGNVDAAKRREKAPQAVHFIDMWNVKNSFGYQTAILPNISTVG